MTDRERIEQLERALIVLAQAIPTVGVDDAGRQVALPSAPYVALAMKLVGWER